MVGAGQGDAGPPPSEQVFSLLSVAWSLLGGSGDQRTKKCLSKGLGKVSHPQKRLNYSVKYHIR